MGKQLSRNKMVQLGIITRSGVFNDIADSDFIITDDELTFFFTSESNLDRFIESYKDNRYINKERVNRGLQGIELNHDLMFDLNLYKAIEKRGFYVWLNNEVLSEEELLSIAITKLKDSGSKEYRKIYAIEEINEIINETRKGE